ncbi:ABC transporter substrate-binding protein [Deinococcus ficus]|uniref:ABC transporter substrate-binding protein n=1 Tax=Deinococcus ficus TaxID=317577 RepID=A0A221ST72_9DEIO|nr:ABC transporter substrate-binding protein [Deinococcus ficus]ASN79831.1 ABC transporter substrate-binding protein [Deinococcus ficus]
MKTYALMAALLVSGASAAGTLVVAGSGEPVTLESGNAHDSVSMLVQRQIYDRLIGVKPGTAELAPGLATSWKPNATATSWTFTLRRNVKFHDGTPFNADAAVFNLRRWWDKNDPNGLRDAGRLFTVVPDFLGGYKGEKNAVVKDVVKVGEYAVRVDLTRPNTVFPVQMSASYWGMSSPTAVKAQGARYGTPAGTAVGTGPFMFRSWVTGDRVTLAANRTYWGVKPRVDALIVRNIKDPSQRLNELRAGTVDIASDLQPDDLKAIQADKNLVLYRRPSFNLGYLGLNNRNEYLKHPKVRQAISLAINRRAIVDAFWYGLGTTDTSILPPALKWATSSRVPADYPFDPAAAKKLLAEAGYPNGFSIDLWYMPITRSYFPNPKASAEAMAADLADVGIRVTLRTSDWAKYLEDLFAGRLSMYQIGLIGDYGDPDYFYGALYNPTSTNDIGWNAPEVGTLLEQARAGLTREARAQAYARVHELTYAAGYRLPIVHSQSVAAARTYVKGWVLSPFSSEPYNTVSLVGKK